MTKRAPPPALPPAPTVSGVLRAAADGFLWDGVRRLAPSAIMWRPSTYSCDAMLRVCLRYPHGLDYEDVIRGFLEELGVQCESLYEFDEFPPGRDRQAARYAWLHFAADLADEWGVTL